MKLVVCVMLVAACSGGGVDCKTAIETAANRFGHGGASEATTLIGECTQRGWDQKLRTCIADAKDGQTLEDCLPALDVKLPLPVVRPSKVTAELAAKSQDVRVLLFYTPGAEVLPVLDDYFKTLGNLAVEHHDRMLEPDAAKRYNVSRDRAVLVHADQHEDVDVDAELSLASRAQLPKLDRSVARAIVRVTRSRMHAYLTIGHGEINDRASVPLALVKKIPERSTRALRAQLAMTQAQVSDLPAATLTGDVPADASVVLVLAPSTQLSAAEYASLERYLGRGGALLIALDPTAPPGLGPLEATLGVTYDHGHLADDTNFVPNKHEPADHRLVVTNVFGTHPSTTMAARASTPTILIDSGSLEAASAPPPGTAPNVTFTVRSMPTTFIDANGNFELDGKEVRRQSNVAAAVTNGSARTIVLADADMLADVLVASGATSTVSVSAPTVLQGALLWLLGEPKLDEALHGDDVAEIQTKASLTAERELLDRRRLRLLARAIAATSDAAHENATSDARHLEIDLADLRQKIEHAKD